MEPGQGWRRAEVVNERALPVLDRLAGGAATGQPFFLFLHYWDPHTPYLPPPPYGRMFYGGDEKDPAQTSMDPVWASPWFANYFREWLEGVRDIEFVKAQYDAAIAYGDACLAGLFNRLGELSLWDDTLLLLHSDHGEELDDHGCWFDHHGLYDTNVRVPLLLRFPDQVRAGEVVRPMVSLPDLAPTVLDVLRMPDLAAGMRGQSLLPLLESGEGDGNERVTSGVRQAVYLTECTWMRKRGWRTPEWKLIEALEPDIYGKPPLELYSLADDPAERVNLAEGRPEVVAALQAERDRHVRSRLAETGGPDPLIDQADALRIWQPRFIAGRRG
jgi:arylsulfatase A-like enzyme